MRPRPEPAAPEMRPRPEPAASPIGDCPAALLAGAAVPISGYCPTHAHESALTAPRVEALRWSLDVSGEPYGDDTFIVTATGRVYLRVDTNDIDSVWIPTRLVAIDPDGTVVFERDFDGASISTPVLTADGTLLLTARKHPQHRLIWLDEGGGTVREVVAGIDLGSGPAVAPDGGLWFIAGAGDEPDRVLALDPSGTQRWLSEPLGDYSYALATGRDGRAVIGSRQGPYDDFGGVVVVTALEPTGAVAWQTEIDSHGHLIDGPAVGPDGAIHAVLWTDKSSKTTLVVLEPSGAVRLRVDVGEEPWGGGISDLAIGGDGATYVKAGETLTAIDAGGVIRWKRPAHPNFPTALTIDAGNTVLVSGPSVTALDAVTGQEAWTFELPPHHVGNAVYFPGIITLADGVMYAHAGEKRIYALGPP
jgi:outer membrane protein assembly factor BamB